MTTYEEVCRERDEARRGEKINAEEVFHLLEERDALRANLAAAEQSRAKWKTVAEGATAEGDTLRARAEKAEAFKAYVHKRLDEAGVPTHPDGPHSKEGCRIGDRLDVVIGERDARRAAVEILHAHLAELELSLREARAAMPPMPEECVRCKGTEYVLEYGGIQAGAPCEIVRPCPACCSPPSTTPQKPSKSG